MTESQKTTTLEDFASHKSSENLNYYNFTIVGTDDDSDLYFTLHNTLDDYLDELMDIAEKVTLTNEDVLKYRYKPSLLSNYLYGDTELFYIILLLNNFKSEADFENISTLYLISPSSINSVLSSIFNSEIDYINTNRENVKQ